MIPVQKNLTIIRKVFFSLALCTLMGSASSFASPEKPVIAVLKSRELAPYNTALDGFKKALKNKGISPTLLQYNMEGDKEAGINELKEARANKPDIILAIGTLATETAKENVKDIPVLFCMVLSPVAGGLVESMNEPGKNLTGSSMDIPLKKQFEILKTVLPRLKTVGVLYNPQETNEIISEAAGVTGEMGIRFIAKPVKDASDIPQHLEELGKDVDCLWSVSDSLVFSSFESIRNIILFTLRNKIPFMGLSPAFVKSGALLAISCDIEDNGYQAGEQAARVLAGQNPAVLPVLTPRKTYLSINTRIAEQIGVTIPRETVAGAKEVFK
ncbi:MAG: ABC transporter substrate-binding protein [Endomicrobiales bacterium]